MEESTGCRFRVGDLVILQNATHYVEYNGYAGIITGEYAPRSSTDLNTMRSTVEWCYVVRIIGSTNSFTGREQNVHARPWQLRRPSVKEQERRLERVTPA